tara:strand:- start:227 stop:367 length:141 start_codon:yes stop_codon:yes gene_type:complete
LTEKIPVRAIKERIIVFMRKIKKRIMLEVKPSVEFENGAHKAKTND